MATINLNTTELANYYLYGNATGDTSSFNNQMSTHLAYFRNAVDLGNNAAGDATRAEIAALDNRIATFQNAITDGAKAGTEDFPYDKELLEREFLEEVYALLLKRGIYNNGTALNSNGTLPNLTTSQGFDSNNFSNMTFEEMKLGLFQDPSTGSGGVPVMNAYKAWIEAVFAEGNKMKNTISQQAAPVVVSISPQTINGVLYDRVASQNKVDGNNVAVIDPLTKEVVKEYFLIPQGASTSGVTKVVVQGTLSTAAPADAYIGLSSGPSTVAWLPCDKDLKVASGATPVVSTVSLLSPMMYLYYWTEARVRVLRGQLNMKEAVTSEIRDDLAKANKAFGDLEKQAGLTRPDDGNTKSSLALTSSETQYMDFFEATNSTKGSQLFDSNAGDDIKNYAEWGSDRSNLKSYIDRKSTDSQNAMLDYQTTLNRFNNAYDVMSKLQEKLDGLLKSQLRNL